MILTGAELSKYFGKETTPREMKDQITGGKVKRGRQVQMGLPPCSFLTLRVNRARSLGTGFTNHSQHLCPRAGMVKCR